jgi:serine/threonine protein kinase
MKEATVPPVSMEKVFRTLEGFTPVEELAPSVWLWKESRTSKEFAVKSFPSSVEVEETFKREANHLFFLRHPCILRFEFCCLPEGRQGPKIVTEFMGEGSLKTVLETVPRWWTNTRKAVTIVGIVVGMSFIHDAGILHRDLKPGNILFDENRRVRISDFGSSRFGGLELTERVGTPLYMAPEVKTSGYDEKVDVYSFGVVLYEIVVGEKILSTGDGIRGFMSIIGRGGRPEIPSKVSPRVRDLISRCWSSNAVSRPRFVDIFEELKSLKFEVLPGVDEYEIESFLKWVEAKSGNVSRK